LKDLKDLEELNIMLSIEELVKLTALGFGPMRILPMKWRLNMSWELKRELREELRRAN
jgi:hypothetical protein